MQLNGKPIVDDYSETFDAVMVAFVVTGPTREIAREAAYETKGLGRSATQPPCECTIAHELDESQTPDGRPGYELHAFDRKVRHLRECLALRLRKGCLPYPKTAVFNALPADLASGDDESVIDLTGTVVHRFADGFAEQRTEDGRELLVLPRMDGPMTVERTYRTLVAVTGGMFLVFGKDDSVLEAALQATAEAAAGRWTTAKCAASGSKVGAIHETDMPATTNHRFCPSLTAQVEDSHVPEGVGCIYEVIVSGPDETAVRDGMRAGIAAASRHDAVVRIGTANYGGKLGSGQIALRDLL